MKKTLLLIGVLSVLAIGGCKKEEEATTDAATAPAASNLQAKPGAAGGAPQMGTAEMQPGISAKEADARVGSANK